MSRSQPSAPASTPDGELVIRTLAMPADANPSGDIFGGWVLSQMDIAGGITAGQRAQGRVATVALEAWALRGRLGERARVTEGRFVFVALGEDGRPRPVPPDEAEHSEEDA